MPEKKYDVAIVGAGCWAPLWPQKSLKKESIHETVSD